MGREREMMAEVEAEVERWGGEIERPWMLESRWTIEAASDAFATHSLDIQSEILSALQAEITRETDAQILAALRDGG